MVFHNPFLKDGQIVFPDNGNLVRHVERWAKVRGDKLAYRFLDFSTERDGVERELNWADFGARNRAVGARLQQVTQPGDRVAILCPQNLDYLVAFFGTLYAGRIAVPLFDPSEPGHVGRLHAVLDDCQPSAILTTTESAEGVRKFFRSRPAKERPRVIAVDAVPDDVGATWQSVDIDRDTIAYLQYTSGSTRIPTGVQITYLNLATNVVQVIEALEGEEGDRGVSWLPFFHDMGLITAHDLADDRPLLHVHDPRGVRPPPRSLDPRDRPQAGRHRRRHLGRPELRVRPRRCAWGAQGRRATLDLSNVKCILNGSEPISAATVRRFNEAFGPFGFQPKAIKPSYGLAEATLFVSTTPAAEEPKIISVDRDELNNHRFVPVPDDSPKAVAQASAGKIGIAEWAAIVDPRPPRSCPTDRSVRSGSVARTWAPVIGVSTRRHVATFQNILKSRTNPSHAEGATDDATWVRTGDFGAYHDGELYITGRTKDLVIIDGRNHYPQDLEYSAQESSKALRTGFVAAFSVPANQLPDEVFENAHSGLKRDPDDTSEQLVIVGERAPVPTSWTWDRSPTRFVPRSRCATA